MTTTETTPSLCCEDAAADWEKFKIAATDYLAPLGFQMVYTSHVDNKELQARFREWFGDPVRCGHKGVKHVEIVRDMIRGQGCNALPICLFEFGQHRSMSPNGIVNRRAIYLTVVAEHCKHDWLAREAYKAIEKLSKIHPRFKGHHYDTCENQAPPGELQLRNAKKDLVDAWLLTAVASFEWVAPEKRDEPTAPLANKPEEKKHTVIDQIVNAITAFFRLFTG